MLLPAKKNHNKETNAHMWMTGVNRNNQGAFSTIYVYTIISVLFLLLKTLPVVTKNSLSLS
jgi:hypothetical protein